MTTEMLDEQNEGMSDGRLIDRAVLFGLAKAANLKLFMQSAIDAETVIEMEGEGATQSDGLLREWSKERRIRAQKLAKHYLNPLAGGVGENEAIATERQSSIIDLPVSDDPVVRAIHRRPVEKTSQTRPHVTDMDTKGDDPVRLYLNTIGKYPLLDAAQEVELAKRIEAGVYAQHIIDDEDRSDHDRARERSLRRIAVEGASAKDTMIVSNTRLVVSIAKRYAGKGLPLLDLIQEGNAGLIHAVEKFDYVKGYKFSTYATWWIRQSVTRGIAEQQRTIRLPVHMVEKVNKAERIKREIFQQLGHYPSNAHIATEMGISEEKVDELFKKSRDTVSLNMPVGDGEVELASFIGGDDEDEIIDALDARELGDTLRQAMQQLNENEQFVLKCRFNIDGGEDLTLEQIGEKMGLTGERVRQIERKALSKLESGAFAKKLQAHQES